MPRPLKRPLPTVEEDPEAEREAEMEAEREAKREAQRKAERKAEGLVDAQVLKAEEEATSVLPPGSRPSTPSSPSSSWSSCSSPSSSSSSSCCCCLESGYTELLGAVDRTQRPLQVPPAACFLPNVTEVTPSTQLCQDGSSPKEEGPGISQALANINPLFSDPIHNRATDLLEFLLLKYRAMEPTTKAEMLSSVIKEHQDDFTVIFTKASVCLQRVFGVDVKEVDASNHSYVLINTLGLTCNWKLRHGHSMPNAGLLINILALIFMRGNRALEKDIWEALSGLGVYDGVEHFIYGDPRELITKVWVQDQYLVYQLVTCDDPARYEFQWGLRAHAETSKRKILEFLAKVNNTDPTAFPSWYEEVLRDEEERLRAKVVVRINEEARAYSTGPFLTFSCLESEADFSLNN